MCSHPLCLYLYPLRKEDIAASYTSLKYTPAAYIYLPAHIPLISTNSTAVQDAELNTTEYVMPHHPLHATSATYHAYRVYKCEKGFS